MVEKSVNIENHKEAAIIIIDSGFSLESMGTGRIIAFADLNSGKTITSNTALSLRELKPFSGDPLNHGSAVLAGGKGFLGLSALMPDSPFVLIRAFGAENALIRTRWDGDRMERPGWTEAYRWAVALCREQSLSTVTNCSFGGYTHAMDGTGWESRQLQMETGYGKPGHAIVAATGPSDGAGLHASWAQDAGETVIVSAKQERDSTYNFWSSAPPTLRTEDIFAASSWVLQMFLDGKLVYSFDAMSIRDDPWNQRKQVKVKVAGSGTVQLVLTRRSYSSVYVPTQQFDCWVEFGDARFIDHIDPFTIAEPAIFQHVLAVGYEHCSYAPDQIQSGAKPDILLQANSETPISFSTPLVTAKIAKLFNDGYHHLDIEGIKQLLGKAGCGGEAQSLQARTVKKCGH